MKMKLYSFLTVSIILILAAAHDSRAQEELRSAIGRHMEYAQPTPNDYNPKAKSKSVIIIQSAENPSYFLNVSTIDDEAEYEGSRMQNESSIAVNPLNPLNMIASAVDYRGLDSWVYVTHDGGKSWENINLGKPDSISSTSGNDPSVAFDSQGNGYVCYGAFGPRDATQSGANGVYVSKTTDEGKTWIKNIPVIEHYKGLVVDGQLEDFRYFEDKYYVHVDNSPSSPYLDHVYIPWKRVTPADSATQIVFSKSSDIGETWSKPINISNRVAGSSEDTTFGQSFPLIRTGSAGEVYCVWNHGIVHGVGFARSLDGGNTWSPAEIIHNYEIFGTTTFINDQGYRHTVKGTVRAEAYPTMEVDITGGERDGYIYVAWAADNVPNIYFSRSTDKGLSWSDAIIVHEVETNDQFWPWIAIDPKNGDIAIMYLDSRDDPDNMLTECYVSYSSNGGESWQDLRASDAGFDLRLNPFGSVTGKPGGVFAGDYNGCAFYDGVIYPSWVDMRPAVEDLRDSDVFTSIINIKAPKPVENLLAELVAEQPDIINLMWENPTDYSLGQPMADTEYTILVYREDEFITELPGGINAYTDTDLTPFEKYNYELFVVAGGDTSMGRQASSYAGGSEKPGVPILLSQEKIYDAVSGEHHVKLLIKMPDKRDDGVTPLTDLDSLIFTITDYISTDSTWHIVALSPQDIGTEFEYTLKADVFGALGWYKIEAAVKEENPDYNISSLSDIGISITASAGAAPNEQTYLEPFGEESALRQYYSANFEKSSDLFTSPNYSISQTPGKNYLPNQQDTMLLIPINADFKVEEDSTTHVELTFYHAAIISSGDAAYLEVSFDDGGTWHELDKYDENRYEDWKDKVLDDKDMKHESYIIGYDEINEMMGTSENTKDYDVICQFRFRFEANKIINNRGWFIDDIAYSFNKVLTSVANELSSSFHVYPVPAYNYLNLSFDEDIKIKNVKLLDILGVTRLDISQLGGISDGYSLDVSGIESGAYFLIAETTSGKIISKKISIFR